MNNGKKEYIFLWFIENYSYCWRKLPYSPTFTFDGLEGKYWELWLSPNGLRDKDRDYISLILSKVEKDAETDWSLDKFELSILAADGSILHSEELEKPSKLDFFTPNMCQFVPRDEILLRRKAEYLPNDTLSIRCKMWTGEGDVQTVQQISARTRFFIEHISFVHQVRNFSNLKPNEKSTSKTHSQLRKNDFVLSSVFYTVDASCGEEKIMIEIVSSDADKILQKCTVSMIDARRNIFECDEIDYGHNIPRANDYKFPLSLTREAILNRKSEYLIEDTLELLCECYFPSLIAYESIEEVKPELSLAVFKQQSDQSYGKQVHKPTGICSEYPSILEDMKAIYKNQRLTDVDLKTKTKSFPAHKVVLCARSPVFEAMMSSDMKEKNTACIRIDDLENDIVEQLLLFLYTDNLDTLQWENTTQLYYAADKYQIGKLKAICSSFLVENLNTSNASELLLLADTHNDCNLKKFAEDFILKHEEQVFISNEWEKLKITNPQLVIDTMCLKYKRRKE